MWISVTARGYGKQQSYLLFDRKKARMRGPFGRGEKPSFERAFAAVGALVGNLLSFGERVSAVLAGEVGGHRNWPTYLGLRGSWSVRAQRSGRDGIQDADRGKIKAPLPPEAAHLPLLVAGKLVHFALIADDCNRLTVKVNDFDDGFTHPLPPCAPLCHERVIAYGSVGVLERRLCVVSAALEKDSDTGQQYADPECVVSF